MMCTLLWGWVIVCVGCSHNAPLVKSPGFSGMAHVSANTYLVVHDTKAHENLPRLGLISIQTDNGINYREILVEDWSHHEGPSSDLESACEIGNSEFLVAESGYWGGAFGRLFHLRLQLGQPQEVRVLHAARLPLLRDNSKTQKGDNFEGLACKVISDGRILVLLGERGGSLPYPTGFIRWGYYNPKLGTLEFNRKGLEGIPISPPAGTLGSGFRSIASLHLTKEGELWASATKDPGDMGPFESLVYRVGTLDATQEAPLKIEPAAQSYYSIHGFKVESISDSDLPGSKLSIATEDETLGGTWRALSLIK